MVFSKVTVVIYNKKFKQKNNQNSMVKLVGVLVYIWRKI